MALPLRPISFSERYVGGINYIRNSVKVTIDAYTGQTDFHLIDRNDPVAVTYAKIFPGLFKEADEMPQSIREHVRYPEDLFTIQAKMYGMYHMRDPEVFYNKEDLWAIPNELYGGSEREVSPYYIRLVLPGESDMGFVLFVPFTPSRKDNMVAWLAVNSDMDDFGRMVAYKFGKQKVIFGPMQIEAQIDQDAEISKMLSLWNQSGSTVIRGATCWCILLAADCCTWNRYFWQLRQASCPPVEARGAMRRSQGRHRKRSVERS